MANISDLGENLIKWGSPTVESVVESKVIVALNYFVGFSALVAVIMIVVAGYTFITASGDPDKIEQAQKGITAAVVGMIIVFLARLLVKFVLVDLIGLG